LLKTSMALNQDIVRGVRRGAILLAAGLMGVAAYRTLHVTSASNDDPSPPVSVPAEEPAPNLTAGPPTVPPPPPLSAAKVVRKRRVPDIVGTALSTAESAEPEQKLDHEVILPVEKDEDAADLTETRIEETPASVAEPEEDPTSLIQPDVVPRKTSPRRLRWLIAVGKFLHLVKRNDVPSQALTTH
jgi:hypothetical protein